MDFETITTSGARCCKHLRHAKAVSAVENMHPSVIPTVNNKNKKLVLMKMVPGGHRTSSRCNVRTSPLTVSCVSNKSVVSRKSQKREILTHYVTYQPIDDNIFN